MIRRIVTTDPSYEFLKTDPRLGDNIILLGLGGSYAYGTNHEGSDIDVRGITMNPASELLMGNLLDPKECLETIDDKETDTKIYSFTKAIKFLTSCNPSIIETLGLLPEQYLKKTELGQRLIDEKQIFLSKIAKKTFFGYANTKLNQLMLELDQSSDIEKREKAILSSMSFINDEFRDKYHINREDFPLYIADSDRDDMDKEIFFNIRTLEKCSLRDGVALFNTYRSILKEYDSVGRRNKKAIEHNKVDKHLTSLVRICNMGIKLMNSGEIVTYDETKIPEYQDILHGKFRTKNGYLTAEFEPYMNKILNALQDAAKNTKLPDTPDYKKINELVLDVNQKCILEKYKKEKYLSNFEFDR